MLIMLKAVSQATELIQASATEQSLAAREICSGHSAAPASPQMIHHLGATPPSSSGSNFDGSVLNGGACGGACFIIQNHINILVVTGGVQIFNTTITVSKVACSLGRPLLSNQVADSCQSCVKRGLIVCDQQVTEIKSTLPSS